ncbi:hypothetical protein [Halomarina rubra]|uniref:Uncharacterized protein n=1 Tax=Halomarina rubra TaxID=2071873 RepID=A0ABD6AUJ5_9EURY|nr:hypothetical protein [Halomarina rubra]
MASNSPLHETRAVSLGGYGSLVPYHGPLSIDPGTPGKSHILHLPLDQPTPEGILNHLDDVAEHLKIDTRRGRLFYSVHYSDYGWNGSGVEQLRQDLQNPFEVGEELRRTLESEYNRELGMHRPCFTILSNAEYGLFYMVLRGGKRYLDDEGEEWEIAYYARSGVLIDQPVLSWPNVEKVVKNDGGPITQHTTDISTESIELDKQLLEGVYPLSQSVSNDADIIGGRNPYSANSADSGDSDIKDSINQTSHLTFRVNGGTIGFENEEAYRVGGMAAYRPVEITMWGHPVVICQPMCDAITN